MSTKLAVSVFKTLVRLAKNRVLSVGNIVNSLILMNKVNQQFCAWPDHLFRIDIIQDTYRVVG